MRLLTLALAMAACTSKAPAPESATGSSPNGSPLVVTCCGDNDSTIMAQMQRYETTPPLQRTADVAVFPFRLNSGLTVRDRMIVRDEISWSKFWLNIVGSNSPVPPTPAVDFSRETIVVANMGQRNTGGYSVSIDPAGTAGDTVILAITERSPGPTCGTTSALTQPLALARVGRPNATIRFVERQVVTDCG
jgi:hypothetical protein